MSSFRRWGEFGWQTVGGTSKRHMLGAVVVTILRDAMLVSTSHRSIHLKRHARGRVLAVDPAPLIHTLNVRSLRPASN